jgi:phosphoglucomutase
MSQAIDQKIASWLEGNFDSTTKEEIRSMQANQPDLLDDAFYRNLEFGTGGLRGLMGVGTNRVNKYTIGMARMGDYMKNKCKGMTGWTFFYCI